jgi:NMD protein affecting ribosome stability and mRNA decay
MKAARKTFRRRQQERFLEGFEKDAYKSARKPQGPARCTDCGAVFQRGRWAWKGAAGPTTAALCPACRRIRERLPAGLVRLSGPFLREHRDEVLRRVRRCEQLERREHPLQRIIAIEPQGEALLVSTTDLHLARRIGDALHDAYKGELRLRYGKADTLLRVSWSR